MKTQKNSLKQRKNKTILNFLKSTFKTQKQTGSKDNEFKHKKYISNLKKTCPK
jgi:uncharacterized protein (UPF0303 family)